MPASAFLAKVLKPETIAGCLRAVEIFTGRIEVHRARCHHPVHQKLLTSGPPRGWHAATGSAAQHVVGGARYRQVPVGSVVRWRGGGVLRLPLDACYFCLKLDPEMPATSEGCGRYQLNVFDAATWRCFGGSNQLR